jgi:hypothetical protein
VSLVALDQALLPGRDYQTKRVVPDWLSLDIKVKDPRLTKQLMYQEYLAEHCWAAQCGRCEFKFGWTPSVDKAKVLQMTALGKSPTVIACGR